MQGHHKDIYNKAECIAKNRYYIWTVDVDEVSHLLPEQKNNFNISNMDTYVKKGILEKVMKKKAYDSGNRVLEVQEFFIIPDGGTKKVMFTAYDEVITLLEDLKPGQKVEVYFRISSKQYKRKWFTNVIAHDIVKLKGQMEIPSGR